MKRKATLPRLSLLVCSIAIIFNCSLIKAQPVISLNSFSGPYGGPVGIYNCSDDRLFVMLQNGQIFICNLNGVINNTAFLNIFSRVSQNAGEQGLLGMAFHPDYANNGYIYVNYINLAGNTVISRFTRSSTDINRMNESSELILMTITQPYANHNGGCMHFGKDGYLYIAQGDGGSGGDPGNRAQNNLEKLGKILRINVDAGSLYAIPPSNPYYGSSFALPEIWAKGVRNPWRWSFDSYNGDMWIGDVGQSLYEEIDYQPAASVGGVNYGWRCYESSYAYNTSANCPATSAITYPVYEYAHSATSGCSVTGGYVYRGGLYGELFGKYIFSDYCSGKMRMIEKTGTSTFVETDLNDMPDNEIASFGEDRYGELYVCFYNSGYIKKLSSFGCAPTAFIKGNASVSACAGSSYTLQAVYSIGLSYQWYKNNLLIAGAIGSTYSANVSGTYTVAVTRAGGCAAVSNAVTLTFLPTAKIKAGGPTTFCAGGSVNLSANTATGLTYQWKKNGVTIAGALASSYLATQAGIYKVKISNTNGCFKNSNTVTVNINCKLAEQWKLEDLNVEIKPNPASSFVTIGLQGLPNHTYDVEIYDMVGKRIEGWSLLTDADHGGIQTIDISNYNKGVYNIIINGENGNCYKKLIVN